jgi:hypothetical protein
MKEASTQDQLLSPQGYKEKVKEAEKLLTNLHGPILEQGKDFAGNIVWIFGNCKRMIPTRKTYNKLVKSAPGKNMGVPFIRIAND